MAVKLILTTSLDNTIVNTSPTAWDTVTIIITTIITITIVMVTITTNAKVITNSIQFDATNVAQHYANNSKELMQVMKFTNLTIKPVSFVHTCRSVPSTTQYYPVLPITTHALRQET